MEIHKIRYPSLITAWEGLNELFYLVEDQDKPSYERDTFVSKNAVYFYNVVVDIDTPDFPEDFDFGRRFNYTMNKWTSLLSNYVDLDALEEFKETLDINIKKNKFYNLAYSFSNNHNFGKKCLMNLTATRRYGNKTPYLTFYLRASEVTKRLAVDFLLAKRIGDYLFDNKEYKIVFVIQQLFQDNTVLLMYQAHRDASRLIYGRKDTRGKRLESLLKFMLTSTEEDFKYKVHRRAFKVIRPDLYQYPKTMIAKNCKLYK